MKKALFGILAIAALIFTTAPPATAEAPPGQEEATTLASKIVDHTANTATVATRRDAAAQTDPTDRPIGLKDDPTDRPYINLATTVPDHGAYATASLADKSGSYAPAIVNNGNLIDDIDHVARAGTSEFLEPTTIKNTTAAKACKDRFKGSGATAGHHAPCTT